MIYSRALARISLNSAGAKLGHSEYRSGASNAYRVGGSLCRVFQSRSLAKYSADLPLIAVTMRIAGRSGWRIAKAAMPCRPAAAPDCAAVQVDLTPH